MLHSAIVVRSKGAIEGDGLFTTEFIGKGAIIWQLDEPTFTRAEISTWQGEKRKNFKRYGFQCGVNRFSLPIGASREMNHSCDPNTWWSGSERIIARRDIDENEEITYDYASCDIDLEFHMVCQCGATCCRGHISNNDYRLLNWQKKHSKNLPAHVLGAIGQLE